MASTQLSELIFALHGDGEWVKVRVNPDRHTIKDAEGIDYREACDLLNGKVWSFNSKNELTPDSLDRDHLEMIITQLKNQGLINLEHGEIILPEGVHNTVADEEHTPSNNGNGIPKHLIAEDIVLDEGQVELPSDVNNTLLGKDLDDEEADISLGDLDYGDDNSYEPVEDNEPDVEAISVLLEYAQDNEKIGIFVVRDGEVHMVDDINREETAWTKCSDPSFYYPGVAYHVGERDIDLIEILDRDDCLVTKISWDDLPAELHKPVLKWVGEKEWQYIAPTISLSELCKLMDQGKLLIRKRDRMLEVHEINTLFYAKKAGIFSQQAFYLHGEMPRIFEALVVDEEEDEICYLKFDLRDDHPELCSTVIKKRCEIRGEDIPLSVGLDPNTASGTRTPVRKTVNVGEVVPALDIQFLSQDDEPYFYATNRGKTLGVIGHDNGVFRLEDNSVVNECFGYLNGDRELLVSLHAVDNNKVGSRRVDTEDVPDELRESLGLQSEYQAAWEILKDDPSDTAQVNQELVKLLDGESQDDFSELVRGQLRHTSGAVIQFDDGRWVTIYPPGSTHDILEGDAVDMHGNSWRCFNGDWKVVRVLDVNHPNLEDLPEGTYLHNNGLVVERLQYGKWSAKEDHNNFLLYTQCLTGTAQSKDGTYWCWDVHAESDEPDPEVEGNWRTWKDKTQNKRSVLWPVLALGSMALLIGLGVTYHQISLNKLSGSVASSSPSSEDGGEQRTNEQENKDPEAEDTTSGQDPNTPSDDTPDGTPPADSPEDTNEEPSPSESDTQENRDSDPKEEKPEDTPPAPQPEGDLALEKDPQDLPELPVVEDNPPPPAPNQDDPLPPPAPEPQPAPREHVLRFETTGHEGLIQDQGKPAVYAIIRLPQSTPERLRIHWNFQWDNSLKQGEVRINRVKRIEDSTRPDFLEINATLNLNWQQAFESGSLRYCVRLHRTLED